VGTHGQGLRLNVAYAAYTHIAFKFRKVGFKFGSKLRIFDVMDFTVKTVSAPNTYATPAGSQV
jgi:hypothetical protein